MNMLPRSFIYGDLSFTRASIPASLADFAWLPKVDIEALSEQARVEYQANLEAYELFVAQPEVSLREIEIRTGIHRKQLYRLLDRVLSKAEDGLIQGLRGLIPYKHIKAYQRQTSVKSSSRIDKSSAAGAMQQLLTRLPGIRKWLELEAKKRVKPLAKGEFREVGKAPKRLHQDFLKKCAEGGIGKDEWPFNQDYQGLRSFTALLKKYELRVGEKSSYLGDDSGTDVVEMPDKWPIALHPFDVVQFDGHKLDVRVTISVPDPFGFETLLEIVRVWILVLTDVRTRAILGYSIALGVEYNKDDFAEALQNAISPNKSVKFTIPGLQIREGGGFPTSVQPELAYHRWNWLQFDEAKSHLANDSLDRVNRVLGTWTMAGRLGEPNDRAIQERFFGLLEEAGFHRIPGTLGSSPNDPRRQLGEVGKDLDRIIKLDELQQVVYVLLANMNGEPHDGVGGRTPLQAMQYFTSKPDFLHQMLPASKRHQLYLLSEAVEVPIRGRKTVVHVNFEGVRYTSDVLARKRELVGQRIRVYFVARDIRKLNAFFMDGSELGVLLAAKPWRTTPHSLRLRKEILRMKRLGKITWATQEDPIEKYLAYKRREAKTSRRAATNIAKVRTGIQAAETDSSLNLAPFASPSSSQPDVSVTDADALTEEFVRQRTPKKVTPTPLNLKKTILF